MPSGNAKNFFRLGAVLLLNLLILNSASAFQKRTIKLTDFYKQIISTQSTSLTFKNVEIISDLPEDYDGTRDFLTDLREALGIELSLSAGMIESKVKSLTLEEVSGKGFRLSLLRLLGVTIKTSEFDKFTISDSSIDDLYLADSRITEGAYLNGVKIRIYTGIENEFKSLNIDGSEFIDFFSLVLPKIENSLYINRSTFKEGAYLSAEFTGFLKDIILNDNVFEPIDARRMLNLVDGSEEPALFLTQLSLDISGGLNQLIIEHNKFKSDVKGQLISVKADIDYFDVNTNLFESSFYPDAVVKNQFNFTDNEIEGHLIFDNLILDGKNNKMYWDELNGFKLSTSVYQSEFGYASNEALGITFEDRSDYFAQNQELYLSIYQGQSVEELEDDKEFQNLISTYYRLYKVFKENGQIKDANKVYIEMKDVESRQLSYIYNNEGGLENYFTWRLNTLLKLYTEYGTNPARAIRISIMVILAFSIFYFFYPSEWDLKSKKQLVDDYKAFVEKNEQGYVRPFIKLLAGFSASLINAMTLSLNAFVTLGFGTIPTSGLARYVCILQGFLGWFLLSIFTASLINQILF
jgi:hypothetical protein